MMKVKIVIFLFFIVNELNAMQPMQWIRNAEQSIEAEEELLKTTQARALEATAQLEKKVNDGTFFSYYEHGRPGYAQWLYNEIKKLLDLGADPNIRFKTGTVLQSNPPQFPTETLLEIAIPRYPQIVKLLLQYGAQPSGLHKALKEGAAEIVKMLIANGADPNASLEDTTWIRLEGERGTLRGDFNRDILPLIYTIELKKSDMFRLLLELGADPYLHSEFNTYWKTSFGPSAYDTLVEKIETAKNADDKALYQAILNSIGEYSQKAKIKL